MISRLLRYYSHLWKGEKFIDFVEQGLGIEVRAKRFANFWSPHLNACKNFQRQLQPTGPTKSLTILGAGRLHDVPLEHYLTHYTTIYFIDADPECVSVWKKLKNRNSTSVDWIVCDVTARLSDWTEKVATFLKSQSRLTAEELEQYLLQLCKNRLVMTWPYPKSDTVVSLNLLSQLGVYWSDRVHQLVERLQPALAREISRFSEFPGLASSIALLEREHLQLLESSEAHTISLIYDDEFYYYQRDRAEWQVEPALCLGHPPEFSRYNLAKSGSWLWHLVPQGAEQRGYGEIHRVQARRFSKQV